MSWQTRCALGIELVLCTTNEDGSPHAIMVISGGLMNDRLVLSDCEMQTSEANIARESRVCLVAQGDGHYYRVEGKAELHDKGRFFDLAVAHNKGSSTVKHAIVITIQAVYDLDNAVRIL